MKWKEKSIGFMSCSVKFLREFSLTGGFFSKTEQILAILGWSFYEYATKQ